MAEGWDKVRGSGDTSQERLMGFVLGPSRVDGCEGCDVWLYSASFLRERTLSSSLGVRQLGGAPVAAGPLEQVHRLSKCLLLCLRLGDVNPLVTICED